MLKLDSLVFNPFSENTYIIYDDKTLECVIVDPGCSTPSVSSALSTVIG